MRDELFARTAEERMQSCGDCVTVPEPDTSQREFDNARLRRLVTLCGLDNAVPEGDLLGCLGTVLGMIAREIEGRDKLLRQAADVIAQNHNFRTSTESRDPRDGFYTGSGAAALNMRTIEEIEKLLRK